MPYFSVETESAKHTAEYTLRIYYYWDSAKAFKIFLEKNW